jgi:RES domain-containing protein
MVYPPELLDLLQEAQVGALEATVYRHMFADYRPDLANTRGARWNPPDVPAIYTSLQRETALAEAEFRISLDAFRPRVKRTLYELRIELGEVLDLSSREELLAVGVGEAELTSDDPQACQLVGGAVAWLGCDGLLVPSARHDGTNLVIFPAAQDPDALFEVTHTELVE